MRKQFFYVGANVREISSLDVEEIITKSDEEINAVKTAAYKINDENERFFSQYLNGNKVNQIVFVTGINFPVKKKTARKIASQMGNIEKALKKKKFPKPNSADIILLLN